MKINFSKKLNPRHDISASIKINDSNSSSLDELKDKYNFSLDLNSNLYPIIPTKNEINQLETLNKLKAEKSKLNNQIMVKNIEWIEKFLNLSKYKSKIKLSKDRLRLEKKLLERTLSQKEIGEAGELDILTARIRVREAELILQNLINNHNEIKNKLIADLGLTNKTLKLNADEEKLAFIREKINKKIKNTEIDLTDKSDLFKRLVKYNYQLKNLKTSKVLANKKIKWEKKDRGLDISTNVGYNYNQKVKDDYWEIAFEVSYEILDGGTAKNKLTDRKRESEIIKKDYNYTLKKLKLDLDKMIEQYLSAKNSYTVYQMKHKRAILQLDKAKMNFKNGVIAKDEIKRKEIIFKESIIALEEAREKILIDKLRIIQYIGLY
jgi:outer membrane protein TolC